MSKHDPNKRYLAVRHPRGMVPPNPRMVVLERHPHVVKAVTKRYDDGRELNLTLVDGKIVEKIMSFRLKFDYDKIKSEKEKGEGVRFQHWEKNGLEVGLTFYGSYLISKSFVLTADKILDKNLIPENWQDELDNDIPFPTVNIGRLVMKDGYSSDQIENDYFRDVMEEELMLNLARHEEDLAESQVVFAAAPEEALESSNDTDDDTVCYFCAECPCVWVAERENVIILVATEHPANGTTVSNSTRRKTSFRYIWRVRNGVGQKNVRSRHPTCVESGVRALFPDTDFMGFKEE
jgi:hypothetical protein